MSLRRGDLHGVKENEKTFREEGRGQGQQRNKIQEDR